LTNLSRKYLRSWRVVNPIKINIYLDEKYPIDYEMEIEIKGAP